MTWPSWEPIPFGGLHCSPEFADAIGSHSGMLLWLWWAMLIPWEPNPFGDLLCSTEFADKIGSHDGMLLW